MLGSGLYMKKHIKYILLIAGIFSVFLFSSPVFAEKKPLFQKFLYSDDLKEVERAYWRIAKHPDEFEDIVLNELLIYSEDPSKTPDRLLYIAAYIRDNRYIEPLLHILKDEEYSENSCIYDCPIVFSLIIYGAFSNYSLPSDLDRNYFAVNDLYSGIDRISKMSLKHENASNHIIGPGVDAHFKKGEFLPTEEIIRSAGPGNFGLIPRRIAAFILQYRLVDPKFLPDLYWLAISEPEPRGAEEFRTAIYWAIYKTEKLRKKEYL